MIITEEESIVDSVVRNDIVDKYSSKSVLEEQKVGQRSEIATKTCPKRGESTQLKAGKEQNGRVRRACSVESEGIK